MFANIATTLNTFRRTKTTPTLPPLTAFQVKVLTRLHQGAYLFGGPSPWRSECTCGHTTTAPTFQAAISAHRAHLAVMLFDARQLLAAA